uniref:Uncharacterized protein n=1 Tax=Anguilla anguilla TaxID=7936 RepID=A0A0E9UHG4_ANGAN
MPAYWFIVLLCAMVEFAYSSGI